MLCVLAGAGTFVFLRLRADLDDAIQAGLRARAEVVSSVIAGGGPSAAASTPIEDPEESIVQVLDSDGRLLLNIGNATQSALAPGDLSAARSGQLLAERRVPGVEGVVSVLASPVESPVGRVLVVVGQSQVNRDEALRDVLLSFAAAGPVAVLASALLGYTLARLGLGPVEQMRQSAAKISSTGAGQRLPLSETRDEIRRLGETLNAMLDRLQRGIERERRFVSDASHQLRTPIAVAKTELEGALLSREYGPEVERSIRAAVAECDSLAQLAEDLLLVARLGEGELALLTEPLPVHPLLEGVRERFADRAAFAGRTITVDAAPDLVLVADRERLRQALGNLVDNALRHGAGTVMLSGRIHGDEVWLDVSDEGSGFEPDLAAHAFERFARGPLSRLARGAGLGLSIVQALAQAHGGTASIVAGPVTTVRISLPRVSD